MARCLLMIVCSMLISNALFAQTKMTCRVTDGSRVFAPFVGGTVSTDLKTGNIILVRVDSSGHPAHLSVVDDQLVSSFQFPRSTCEINLRVQHDSSGNLISVRNSFVECFRGTAIDDEEVTVVQKYSVATGQGTYTEYYDSVSSIEEFGFEFRNCEFQ